MAHTGPSLIDEFNLLKTFLGQQKVTGRDITNAVVMQHNQFLLKIKGLARIDLEVANSLQNVIASDALWTSEQTNTLMDSIMQRLVSPANKQGVTATSFQKCKTFPEYLTAKDWAIIDRPDLNITLKAHCVLYRCCKLGFKHIADHVFQKMVAILVTRGMGLTNPRIPQLHAIAITLKDMFPVEVERQRCPLPYLIDYPMSPAALPIEFLNHAYDADDPHVPCTTPSLINMIACLKFMRTTATGVKAEFDAQRAVSNDETLPGLHIFPKGSRSRCSGLNAPINHVPPPTLALHDAHTPSNARMQELEMQIATLQRALPPYGNTSQRALPPCDDRHMLEDAAVRTVEHDRNQTPQTHITQTSTQALMDMHSSGNRSNNADLASSGNRSNNTALALIEHGSQGVSPLINPYDEFRKQVVATLGAPKKNTKVSGKEAKSKKAKMKQEVAKAIARGEADESDEDHEECEEDAEEDDEEESSDDNSEGVAVGKLAAKVPLTKSKKVDGVANKTKTLTSTPLLKRPATVVLKRPATKAPKHPSAPVLDKESPMQPYRYMEGNIHASFSRKGFRAFPDASDVNHEKAFKWDGDSDSAWLDALKFIDAKNGRA